jgi:transposase-like protein
MAQRNGERWTSSVAQRILAEQERSGLSVAAFARTRGLHGNRLRWWRKQLGKGLGDVPAVLPVRVVEAEKVAVAPASVEVVLRGSGHTLRFNGAVDVGALVALLEGGC